jgi:hypothetical protein
MHGTWRKMTCKLYQQLIIVGYVTYILRSHGMGGRVDRLTELATATTEGVEHQIKTQGWWQYVAEAVE